MGGGQGGGNRTAERLGNHGVRKGIHYRPPVLSTGKGGGRRVGKSGKKNKKNHLPKKTKKLDLSIYHLKHGPFPESNLGPRAERQGVGKRPWQKKQKVIFQETGGASKMRTWTISDQTVVNDKGVS